MRTLTNGITQSAQELVDIQNVSGGPQFENYGFEIRSASEFFWVYSVKADTFTLVERYTVRFPYDSNYRPDLSDVLYEPLDEKVVEVPRVTLTPNMFKATCYSIENVEVHRESEGRLDDAWYYRDMDTGIDYEKEV